VQGGFVNRPIAFGKYLLLDRISVGGMAEVFLAKVFGEGGESRLVALKRILPLLAADREFVSMFLDEARIAVQLDHPNIAQIFELGRIDESYYIAMEYVAGRDLRALVDGAARRQRRLGLDQVLELISSVAEGLEHAHQAADRQGLDLNIVHRDVSPQNVLISSLGQVKLIDFGIAKASSRQQETQVGILKGKFGYMSPEQAQGLPIDRRSDLFALGIIFHELLTGRRLFAGESDLAILERVRRAEIAGPRQEDPAIPIEVERIVMKALAREADDRYQRAAELLGDLRAYRDSRASNSPAESLGDWLRLNFAEELQRDAQRTRDFRAIARPSEIPVTGLGLFASSRSLSDRQEDFNLQQTMLMLPGSPAAAKPKVEERSPPRPPGQPTPPEMARAAPIRAAPPRGWKVAREGVLWSAGALVMVVAALATGLSARRAFFADGDLVITTRPSETLEVEVDARPLPLDRDGVGVMHGLRPGDHLVLAKGPNGNRALQVTVVANQITSLDLSPPSEPPSF
jgi:eukaryotic-like serine/threonine-protein kinase